jgi:hypothetical protein
MLSFLATTPQRIDVLKEVVLRIHLDDAWRHCSLLLLCGGRTTALDAF